MKEGIKITPHSIELIIDGSRSDPITPLTPKEKEHIDQLRERYIKAGLIKPLAPASPDSSTQPK